MPKFYCENKNCTEFEKSVDIDTSFLAYYSNLDHKDFIMQAKVLMCKDCQTKLSFDKPKESGVLIGKYGIASYEDKMNMLRKRSRDSRINVNREQKQRKEYMDKTGSTKYVN